MTVFSTGASSGLGTAMVRPGLRARKLARRRERSTMNSAPARSPPPPVSPVNSQAGVTVPSSTVASALPVVWSPLPTGDAGVFATCTSGREVGADEVGAGVSSDRPDRVACPELVPTSGRGVEGRSAPVRGDVATVPALVVFVLAPPSGCAPTPCRVFSSVALGDSGMVTLQPTTMKSGSVRWAPPG